MKSKKSLIVLIITVLFIIIAVVGIISKDRAAFRGMNSVPSSNTVVYDSSYQGYLDNNGFDGVIVDAEVNVDLNNYTTANAMTVEKAEDGLITGDTGSITWSFNVEKEGFYNLEIGYIARPGTYSDIQRRLYINNEICYKGLQQIVFKRFWNDEPITEKNGNEIRPNINEVFKNTKLFIEDYQKRIGEPYAFYLKKGLNTITFEVIKEPVEFTGITFKKANKAPDYNTVIADLKSKYQVYNSESIVCQAERAQGGTTYIEKNSSSINIQKNYSDTLLVPYHTYKIKYNTIGAANWKLPGNAITWTVDAPQEGLYELTFKGRQSIKRGVTSCRRLYVNGVVPYEQMNAINFDFSIRMTNYTVADTSGTPFLFYLKKGSNTITLESVMGDFGGVINDVEDSMRKLNQLYLGVVQITGVTPDKYIDYEIEKKFPEFSVEMANESDRLLKIVDRLVEITGEKGENTSLLQKMAVQARTLSKNPEGVTTKLGPLKDNIAALGTWLVTVSEMPLELDSLVLSGENAKLPRARNNSFESLSNGIIRFFTTFFVKTNQVASSSESTGSDSITVWMVNAGSTANVQSAGKEQAQIIQNLIDETFAPTQGINVKLQLIPMEVVLRAALAGNSPDVLIGVSQGTLHDFAMRGAVVDLSKFNDFEKETDKYYQSTIDAASYQDGVYGIPEQADYYMMFYRKDILDKIGVEIPRTWEEFKSILPILRKYNYEAFLPFAKNAGTFFPSMVYQYGGKVYEGEGKDFGISTGLGGDAALLAFQSYTEFFTNYKLNGSADFINRFRTGEIPIGLAKYTTYNQFEVFAPEIKGLWSFAPIPGYQREDGTIDNSYLVETVNCSLLQSSKKQDQAWEFMKWWTSTDTQLQYANTVEAVMGTSARYPAANPEVMKQLPWSNAELEQLNAQMEHTLGMPAVPGSYMMYRMVEYAFNNVVTNNVNPREELYLNIKTIDREITNKRNEFKLSTAE